jgi:hypothetical protein
MAEHRRRRARENPNNAAARGGVCDALVRHLPSRPRDAGMAALTARVLGLAARLRS